MQLEAHETDCYLQCISKTNWQRRGIPNYMQNSGQTHPAGFVQLCFPLVYRTFRGLLPSIVQALFSVAAPSHGMHNVGGEYTKRSFDDPEHDAIDMLEFFVRHCYILSLFLWPSLMHSLACVYYVFTLYPRPARRDRRVKGTSFWERAEQKPGLH